MFLTKWFSLSTDLRVILLPNQFLWLPFPCRLKHKLCLAFKSLDSLATTCLSRLHWILPPPPCILWSNQTGLLSVPHISFIICLCAFTLCVPYAWNLVLSHLCIRESIAFLLDILHLRCLWEMSSWHLKHWLIHKAFPDPSTATDFLPKISCSRILWICWYLHLCSTYWYM